MWQKLEKTCLNLGRRVCQEFFITRKLILRKLERTCWFVVLVKHFLPHLNSYSKRHVFCNMKPEEGENGNRFLIRCRANVYLGSWNTNLGNEHKGQVRFEKGATRERNAMWISVKCINQRGTKTTVYEKVNTVKWKWPN